MLRSWILHRDPTLTVSGPWLQKESRPVGRWWQTPHEALPERSPEHRIAISKLRPPLFC
jgi:hypothetical protein